MDINVIGLSFEILCISGLLGVHNVFGETDNMVTMFKDIRNELNSLKLSTEHNKRELIRLKNRVNECHTKYADLTAFVHFENRLTDIENKVKARHQEILKRDEPVEISTYIQPEHDTPNNNESTEVQEEKAVGRSLGGGSSKMRAYGVNGDHDANVSSGADGLNIDGVKGRRHQLDKRIIPVTSAPAINTKIAFSAHVNQIVNGLKDTHIIPFNTVKTNEGQAFDTVTHIFTCPISGIYFFASSLVVEKQVQHDAVYVVKNGMTLAAIDFHQGFGQSSNSVVTVCNKDDRVWVRAMSDGMTVYGLYYTTFSGFLLSTL